MKKICFPLLAVLLVTTGDAQSQTSANGLAFGRQATVLPDKPAESLYLANTRALRSFRKQFGAVEQESWYTTNEGLRVKFVQGGILQSADYSTGGRLQYLVKTYGEELLPRAVRNRVKSEYFDHSIFLVQEIQCPLHETIYLVKIEDKTSWLTLRVSDQDIGVLESYDK